VSDWPALPLEDWKDTYATLHMYSQVVGKVRLALTPRLNHWWNVPLYLDARGLTTSAIPWKGGVFEIRFDFLDHALVIERDDGASRRLPLEPRTVADFYGEVRRMLRELAIEPKIWRMPVEIPDPIPFDEDRTHAAYDPKQAAAFWRVLVAIAPVFEEFRAEFLGKSSPVHFFWGSFDLASTRFSGRRAPERPGADATTREAYSHEVWSAGFWPGGAGVAGPAFYAYAAPEPPGFASAAARPAKAFYHPELKEFLLMYDDVRRGPDPRGALGAFLESTYVAAADLGGWDRKSLER
jgi:uncharacterized protein DUF5996